MQITKDLMGMPITVNIPDTADEDAANTAFAYFQYVDDKFSTYKTSSEISAINAGALPRGEWSTDMNLIFALAEDTKKETNGYFDIRRPDGKYDPSGIVKGWAIFNAAKLLDKAGYKNFFIEAGGDIEVRGRNAEGGPWRIGIKNPFDQSEIVKAIYLNAGGVATSGTYLRGLHIYDTKRGGTPADEIKSITVVGPNIYEADRFATAAFAMGKDGIDFIEQLAGFEGYSIDKDSIATMTSGFDVYTKLNA
jgi:FAD:protein FMN transferase